jgi:hypothetical protein
MRYTTDSLSRSPGEGGVRAMALALEKARTRFCCIIFYLSPKQMGDQMNNLLYQYLHFLT